MCRITILMAWLFLPLTAVAESVAVLPVTYTIYRTNQASEERAAKVMEAVVRGVENAGLTPMTGADINQESSALASPNETYCKSSECALQVAHKVGADLGVLVWVSDQDGQFDIQIITTHTDPIAKSPFGTLKSVTKRIEALVEDSLKEGLRNLLSKANVDDSTPAPGTTTTNGETDADSAPMVEPADDLVVDDSKTPPAPIVSKRKPFDPAHFWSVFGVTAAVGVGYGASETVGFVKKKNTDNPSNSEKKRLDAWQLANRITLGVTAAGVIATGVMAFFTEFKDSTELGRTNHRELTADRLKLIPAVSPGRPGAGLALTGAF